MSELIQKAQIYAVQKQKRINQSRVSSRKPPEIHLKSVAEMVSRVTAEIEVIVAAWLHDVVEDTPATFEDIEQEFGPGVARLVEEVTDTSRPTDGTPDVRDTIDRIHAAQASSSAKTIKLADLIDTCLGVCKTSPQHAPSYLVRAWALLPVLREGNPQLYRQARATVGDWAQKLGVKLGEAGGGEPAPQVPPPAFDRSVAARWPRLFVETFTAAEIGEALHSFDLGTSPEAMEATMRRLQWPVAGIRREGVLVGYLGMDDVAGEAFSRDFRPFSERQVLDGSAPLADVIFVLTRHDFCFISLYGTVVGVISRAEIQKPVVRMWLFGMITFLELELVERIRQAWPRETWQELLSQARLERARVLFEERRRRNLPGSLLECLQFADKMQLLTKDPAQRAAFGFKTKGAADRVIKDLESLRNNLAHAQDIVSQDWPQIARLAYRILSSSGID